MQKLIILDRDGVINYDSDDYIKSPDEWQPIPSSITAITQLTQAGYSIAIASNQSGIGRGFYTEEMLTAIHNKMQNMIEAAGGQIQAIYYCPHLAQDHCLCRKPKPGLLYKIAEQFQASLQDVSMVGDKYSDIEAALAAKATPILVKTGKGLKTIAQYQEKLQHIPIYDDLASYIEVLLNEKK